MKETTRRDFLRKAGNLALIGISLPVLSSLTSCEQDEGALILNIDTSQEQNTISISDYPVLNDIGGVAKITFEGENDGYAVFIVRKDVEEFLILSTKCTHLGCVVGAPTEAQGNFKCGCHGAQFSSLDGSVKGRPRDNTDIDSLNQFEYTFKPSTMELTVLFS